MTLIYEIIKSSQELKTLFPYAGFIIPISFILIINIHKYLTSDYYIQKFYSSHTIQLLSKIVIPIKYILINLTLTSITITIIFYWMYRTMLKTHQIKPKNISFDNLIKQLSMPETQKTLILIIVFFILTIAGLQFIVPAIININKNEQLKIKKSNFYISSKYIYDIFPTIPKDINIYLGQKFKKNYILAYYFQNNLPYRIVIPEDILFKLPIIPENKKKTTTITKEFEEILKNKYLRILVLFIVPAILFLISNKVLDVLLYWLELVIILSPSIIKKLLKLTKPYLKKIQKQYFYFLDKIPSFIPRQQRFNKIINGVLTFILIFTTNLIIIILSYLANFIQIKKWNSFLITLSILSIMLTTIFIYLVSNSSNKE